MKTINLPRQPLLVSVAIGLVVPYLARVPGMPWRGWDWLASYWPGLSGLPMFVAFSLIPSLALYGLGKAVRRAPLAYWFAAAALTGFLLWTHGNLDLNSSSTAVIALFFIPVYALGAVLGGWTLGGLFHVVTQDGTTRPRLAVAAMTLAILAGIAGPMSKSISTTQRLARFPVVTVGEARLAKRQVLSACCVRAMALDDFDALPGKEIAVLGNTGLTLLEPSHYTTKSTSPFEHQGCEHCVHMYPYLVPDGRGGLLVATSDGLSDDRGRLLWQSKAEGFSKTVPVRQQQGATSFVAYHTQDRIDIHGIDGRIAWSARLPVQDVGRYVAADGREMPYAITCCQQGRRLHVYDASGKQIKTMALPEWADTVQAIAWPRPGHLLVGGGNLIAVLDPDGREVLRHVIRGTSFDPYHGPDGVSVQFRASEAPYLAVASHGSSGYARSVLLLFHPRGGLVWQEETKKLQALAAVPGGTGEVLLVGGMDGVIEYRLPQAGYPSPAPRTDVGPPRERVVDQAPKK